VPMVYVETTCSKISIQIRRPRCERRLNLDTYAQLLVFSIKRTGTLFVQKFTGNFYAHTPFYTLYRQQSVAKKIKMTYTPSASFMSHNHDINRND
jgi:hypothetical protein